MAVPPTIIEARGQTRLTMKSTLAVTVGDLIGHDGTDWVLADADARIRAEYIAMVTATLLGQTIPVCRAGVLVDADAPYTAGADQYLSATAGAHGAAPAISATLTILQRIGKALSTTEHQFDLDAGAPTLLRATVAYDPASLAAVTARSDTATITGLLTTDKVRGVHTAVITGTGWDTGLVIQGMDVSGADTLRIRLTNPTAGALDGASVAALQVYVERLPA